MADRGVPKSDGWFTGRTRLITIVSILAVGVAGASAVSANIGILDSASDSAVGTVSATGDLAAPATDATSAPVTTAAATTTAPDTNVQEFTVDVAGTVAVAATANGLRLESVSPNEGWGWRLAQRDASNLAVTFTNGVRTFEFTAVAGPDGTIAANVDEPILTPAPSAGAPVTGGDDDGQYDDDAYEDDSYDDSYDDEHDDDHHDEDADHEEYEGRDDDD